MMKEKILMLCCLLFLFTSTLTAHAESNPCDFPLDQYAFDGQFTSWNGHLGEVVVLFDRLYEGTYKVRGLYKPKNGNFYFMQAHLEEWPTWHGNGETARLDTFAFYQSGSHCFVEISGRKNIDPTSVEIYKAYSTPVPAGLQVSFFESDSVLKFSPYKRQDVEANIR